jgi:translation initiation factor IF-3
MLGVFSVTYALSMAMQMDLDLVEIAPMADPPVCKIQDFGKFKYEAQKKAHEARRKQKVVEIKEVKVRPAIAEGDYQVKLRAIRDFLEDGDKVKITLRFKGREITHQELGLKLLGRIQEELTELAKVEFAPKLEGKQMVMVLGRR